MFFSGRYSAITGSSLRQRHSDAKVLRLVNGTEIEVRDPWALEVKNGRLAALGTLNRGGGGAARLSLGLR
jgi:hypothetical protein